MYVMGSEKVSIHKCCVLFDPASGEVVSVYESITLEGAALGPTEDVIEARAKTNTKHLLAVHSRHFDERKVGVLFVNPEQLPESAPFRVDLDRRKLVPAVADKSAN